MVFVVRLTGILNFKEKVAAIIRHHAQFFAPDSISDLVHLGVY